MSERSAASKIPEFLTTEDVLALHEEAIEAFGGAHGIRDQGLLESAVAAPQATFGGDCLHEDLFAMAAAYAFHLCKNHPFLDGNKRTAFYATVLFLDRNGIGGLGAASGDSFADTLIAVAAGRCPKEELPAILRALYGR